MEKLAFNNYQTMYDRTMRKNVPGVIQIDVFNALLVQLLALSKRIQNQENKI